MASTDANRDNNLASLRFIGAYMVVIGHSWVLSGGTALSFDPISSAIHPYSPFEQPLHGLGVMLFFVISGYLVAASFERSKSVVAYGIARALRIYPALIVAVFVCALLLGPALTTLPLSSYFEHRAVLQFVLRNSSLVMEMQFGLPGVFHQNPIPGVNGALWTLPIELRMYFLVAVFGLLRLLRNRHVFNLFAALLVFAFVNAPDSFPLLATKRHDYLGLSFLLGTLAYVNREQIVYRAWGLVALGALAALAGNTPIRDLVATTTYAYFVVWVGFHPTIRLPKLDRFGDFSYGIYLYAFPIQQLAVMAIGGEHPASVMWITLLAASLLGACSWYAVERPALDWKRRLLARSGPRS